MYTTEFEYILSVDCMKDFRVKSEVKSLSHVRLFETPWTVAYEAPPSMGFSMQECWSGLPFPSPGGLPDPGIEPRSPTLHTDVLPSELRRKPLGTVWVPLFCSDHFPNSVTRRYTIYKPAC